MSAVLPSAIQNVIGIISDAMFNSGKLRMGDEPGSEDLAKNMRALNKIIMYLITKGCKLFLIENITVPLNPPNAQNVPQSLYTFGPLGTNVMNPKPMRVISGYYLYTTGDQYPLTPISYPAEYEMLSNLTQPGAVNSYAVDKQAATLNVYLWNPPDLFCATNGQVHLLMEVGVLNFTGVTDTMMFPSEWAIALEWILSDQLSVGKPMAVIARCAAYAKKYQEELENWDVEDADTIFQPDQRIYQNTGRFK